MRYAILTLAAGLVLAGSTSAQAPMQQPIPAQPQGYGSNGQWNPGMIQPQTPTPPDPSKHRHGWLPAFRNLFGKKSTKSGGCDDCANGGAGSNGPIMPASTGAFKQHHFTSPPPAANSGTLVFPNHQFVRSPRDFFMQD